MIRNTLRISAALLAAAVVAIAIYAFVHWAPDQSLDELKARWAQAPSEFVAVDGMLVHLRDEGPRDDPSPIVLIHGTSSSLHTWDDWTAELQRTRRVIRFDLPGFGLTGAAPHGDYSVRKYAEFVVALLDRLEIDRVVIAGNSLGGNIAWLTAARYPGRVSSLILVDSSGYAVASRSVPIAFKIASIPVLNTAMQSLLPRKFVRDSVENVFGDPTKVTDELVDRYFDMATRSGNRAAMVQRFAQLAPGADAHLIKTIAQPTLILWGARDELIPLSAGERFAAEIPNSQLRVFDALGHVPQEEDPLQSLLPVIRFLESGHLTE